MRLRDFNHYCYEHILDPMSADTQSLNFRLQYHPKIFLLPHQMSFTQKLSMVPDVQMSQQIFSTKSSPVPWLSLQSNEEEVRTRNQELRRVGNVCEEISGVLYKVPRTAADLHFHAWFI